jgi:hypothetical protein
MRAPGKRSLAQLAQELTDTAGSVPVLLRLHAYGGLATCEALASQVDAGHLDNAMRWAIAGHLMRRVGASGTLDLDQPGTVYAFTDIGAALAGSLAELDRVMRTDSPPPNVKHERRGGNQKDSYHSKTPVSRSEGSKTMER